MATLLTEEQYLIVEREAEWKSEFRDGQRFEMPFVTPAHAMLGARIGALLHRNKPGCETYSCNLRIRIPAANTYTYADCLVICGEPQCADGQDDAVLNPLLLVEILSPATEGYDRGRKFEVYRTIPTFQEYLLIEQDRIHVEHYSRQEDGGWLLREYSGNDATVAIARLNIRIALSDLYADAISPRPESDQ